MKERFVFGSSSSTRGRRRLLIVTLLAIAIFFVDVLTHGAIRSTVRTAMSHFWFTGNSAGSAIENTGWFATHSRLAHDNASLREQIAHYQEDAAVTAALRDENNQLRSLVHLAAQEQGITAAVVSSLSASPYGTFLISANPQDVRSGDLVLSDGGFVIGRITEVSKTTALVTELFASDAAVEGIVAGAAARIDGYGGGNARAAIARAIKVVVGDVVTAPALGQRPIGIVGSVQSDAASADQKIFIRLPVNLGSLRYVYVVHTP